MYTHLVLGGTFDHLHDGHKDFLSRALSKADKVTIGLTKASMNTSKILADQIQPWKIRQRQIAEYAKRHFPETKFRIIPITDMFGTTLADRSIDAIAVTSHTIKGAEIVNQRRRQLGLTELVVEQCEFRTDEDGEVLSSTNIRLGKLDRHGQSYAKLFEQTRTISEAAKTILKRPFGKAVGARKIRSELAPLIAIGDIVTQYCIENTVHFNAAYVDGRSRRKKFELRVPQEYMMQDTHLTNHAGTISQDLARQIHVSAAESIDTIYKLTGEEDLLTAAAVLLLPFGSRVLYGYPFQPSCARMITVNQKNKEFFRELILSSS